MASNQDLLKALEEAAGDVNAAAAILNHRRNGLVQLRKACPEGSDKDLLKCLEETGGDVNAAAEMHQQLLLQRRDKLMKRFPYVGQVELDKALENAGGHVGQATNA